MLNFIKWCINPDLKRLENLFAYYKVPFNKYSEVSYDNLIEKINKESLSLTDVPNLKINLNNIKFIISAKNYFIKLYALRDRKIVSLRVEIDQLATNTLGHSPLEEMYK